MQQLQYLTQSDFSVVITACRAYESQYVTLATGEVVQALNATDASHKQADEGLRRVLYLLSDAAFTELMALAWTGRGVISGSGWDFSANLEHAVQDSQRDSSGRDYMMAKAYSLRDYLEKGLAHSGATFLRAG